MLLSLALLLLLTCSPAAADSAQPVSKGTYFPPPETQEKSLPAFSLLTGDEIQGVDSHTDHETAESRISFKKKGEIAALSISTDSQFSPYFGAGLDKASRSESVLEVLANRKQSAGYLLGAGVGYDLGGQTRLGLDYRYTPTSDSSLIQPFPSSNNINEGRHRISFGLEILF